MSVRPELATEPYCYLTTRGRMTGRPHRIEIWFALDGDTVYLLSGGRERSDWVKNLRLTPEVTVEVGHEVFPGRARVVDEPDEDERARSRPRQVRGELRRRPLALAAQRAAGRCRPPREDHDERRRIQMRIAVIGTGPVGQALAGKLAELGHEVTVGTRDPEETLARTEPDYMGNPPFRAWLDTHPGVSLATPKGAAVQAELIVNATNGAGSLAILEAAGEENAAGKVLIDTPSRSTTRRGCHRRSSSPTSTRSGSRSSAPSRPRRWSRR